MVTGDGDRWIGDAEQTQEWARAESVKCKLQDDSGAESGCYCSIRAGQFGVESGNKSTGRGDSCGSAKAQTALGGGFDRD